MAKTVRGYIYCRHGCKYRRDIYTQATIHKYLSTTIPTCPKCGKGLTLHDNDMNARMNRVFYGG